MDWSLFWTIIFQIVLALLLLPLPAALGVLLITSAWESGTRKPNREHIFRG